MTNRWTVNVRRSRLIGLAISAALLTGLGLVGIWLNRDTTAQAEAARRAEAVRATTDASTALVRTLQALTAELAQFAARHPFRLKTNDPADIATLRDLVGTSRFYTRGALLTDPVGTTLSGYASGTLSADDDPGWLSMIQSTMIPTTPGMASPIVGLLSPAMAAGDASVISIGFIMYDTRGARGGLFGLADLRNPYVEATLRGAVPDPLSSITVVDGNDRVVAGDRAAVVGTTASAPVRAALARTPSGSATGRPTATTASVAGRPGTLIALGGLPGGWRIVGGTTDAHLLGALRTRGSQVTVALLTIVVFTMTVLAVTGIRADVNLRRSEERFRALVQNGSDIITVVGRDGVIRYASPSFTTSLGFPAGEERGAPADRYVHPEDRASVAAVIRSALIRPGKTHRLEFRLLRADGEPVWVDASIMNMRSSPVGGVVLNARDTTDSRQLREQLHEQANLDTLTGLANRRRLYDRLAEALDGCGDRPVAVMYLDLDRFKPVNDRLGHEAGDELLRQVVGRIRPCLRTGDAFARVGGDEFAIVLPGVAANDARRLAGRILAALEPPFRLAGNRDVQIGASIGLEFARSGDRPDDVLGRADHAMYRAKRAGGQRHSGAAEESAAWR